MTAARGPADLFRALASLEQDGTEPDSRAERFAVALGLVVRERSESPQQRPPDGTTVGEGQGAGQVSELPDEESERQGSESWPPMPFCYLQRHVDGKEAADAPDEQPAELSKEPAPGTGELHATGLGNQSLATWSRLWPRLRAALVEPRAFGPVDTRRMVAELSRAKVPQRFPRKTRFVLPRRLVVKLDTQLGMIPFYQDQQRLLSRLRRTWSPRNVQVHVHMSGPGSEPLAPSGRHAAPLLATGDTVLVLGDLGAYGGVQERAAWRSYGQALQGAGHRVVALLPVPAQRWPRALTQPRSAWHAVPWECPAPWDWGPPSPQAIQQLRVQRLLRLLSFAVRIEPQTLRAARKALPRRLADVGTEVDLWRSDAVEGSHSMSLRHRKPAVEQGAVITPSGMELEAFELQWLLDVGRAVLRRHGRLSAAEIAHEEVLGLAARAPSLLSSPELPERARVELAGYRREAVAFLEELPRRCRLGEIEPPDGFVPWFERLKARQGPLWREESGVSGALEEIRQKIGPQSVAETRYHIWQTQMGLAVSSEARLAAEVVPTSRVHLAEIRARGPYAQLVSDGRVLVDLPLADAPVIERSYLPCTLVTDLGSWELGLLDQPKWASAIWRDAEGLWAEVVLDEVPVRLVWQPARRSMDGGSGADGEETEGGWFNVRPDPLPRWANAVGADDYGLWVDVVVEQERFRLRWVPPGRFLMGSPESEWGRFDDEGPQHEVLISEGLFLAEAPVTQGLWEAVMGDNPSHFKGRQNPVEKVSWDECQRFLGALNKLSPGLECRLPSEAEWEYSCRAGTTTGTYAGELSEVEASQHAMLDPIAWWRGNSEGETHPVKGKRPNRWGLYDMLGNVDEWCADRQRRYRQDAETDPSGPTAEEGSPRVVRGGSWSDYARHVRAASRDGDEPVNRYDALGLRVARGSGRGLAERASGAGGAGQAGVGGGPAGANRPPLGGSPQPADTKREPWWRFWKRK